MKLALIRARYDPFGGAERFLNGTADAMIAQGHIPTIITRAWPARADMAIAHETINPLYITKSGRDRSFANAVRAHLETHQYDLVQSYERMHGCDVFHAVDGIHAEWLAQRRRIQTAPARLGVALNPHHRYVLGAERAMYESPRLRAVICISEMVKQDILRHYHVAPDKLHVVYGPIDTAAFHPGLRDVHRAVLRQKYGIAETAPVAIHVGSGFERKGVAALLRAVSMVPGLFCLVVGRDKRIARYQSMVRMLGIERRVFFTGGIADVRPYYAASDVFVMPTIYEPFGLVYGEAMACGLPAVVSAQSGAADWITHGTNGFVVDALDIVAIRESIKQAISEPEIGVRGRATVEIHRTEDKSAQYATIYQQLLATPNP